jgi:hypothetical protein
MGSRFRGNDQKQKRPRILAAAAFFFVAIAGLDPAIHHFSKGADQVRA